MKRQILDEVIACLPEDRTLFHYFKGQYAYQLLAYASKRQASIREIKQSVYNRLLNQADIKLLLAELGHGKLHPEIFEHVWREHSQPFVLTVDRWGDSNRWLDQTTRKGCNLVLQLNFSEQHNKAYQRLIKPEDDYLFNYAGHPVMDRRQREFYRDTLAWARIDFDLDSGEALIEEIQSDWVRRVKSGLSAIRKGKTPWYFDCCKGSTDDFIVYAENILAPFYSLWSEAMLSSSIHFIYRELGINRIYYHTVETGQKVKQVIGAPPRSLYSDLPRRFCFQVTDEDPEFISKDRGFIRKKRSLRKTAWYKLEI